MDDEDEYALDSAGKEFIGIRRDDLLKAFESPFSFKELNTGKIRTFETKEEFIFELLKNVYQAGMEAQAEKFSN